MRRCRSVLVVLAVCGLLSGCWLQVGVDAGHSNHNGLEQSLTAANAATLSQAWSAELLQTATEPMVRGDRVYLTTGGFDAASSQSRVAVQALRATDGALVWNRDVANCCCGTPSLDFVPATFVGQELWTGVFLLAGTVRPEGVVDESWAGRPPWRVVEEPVGSTNPGVPVTLRWKLRGSRSVPHTAS
jgi:hypothetical protein